MKEKRERQAKLDEIRAKYEQKVKDLSECISQEFYQNMCSAPNFKQSRLTLQKIRSFISKRYGDAIADKMQYLLDLSSGQVNLVAYQEQICKVMTNQELLYQMGFDFYDSNNDEMISEMDLFKIFQLYGNMKTP